MCPGREAYRAAAPAGPCRTACRPPPIAPRWRAGEQEGRRAIDTGFAALLILLAVVDEGLGAVFFGIPDTAGFRARFGVPDEWTPIGAIAVGHPDPPADPVSSARTRDRKSLDELVHRGRW